MMRKRSREVFIGPSQEEVFTCPMCFSGVPVGAIHCPHCGKGFVEDTQKDGRVKEREENVEVSSAGEDLLEYLEGSEEWMESSKNLSKRTALKESEEESESLEETEEDYDKRNHPKDTLKNLARDKVLFYTGMALIVAGGPGMAFGSWLHDVLMVPIVGDTYYAFGWLNVLFAAAGGIVLISGVILLVLSMKGGIISEEELKILKSEG